VKNLNEPTVIRLQIDQTRQSTSTLGFLVLRLIIKGRSWSINEERGMFGGSVVTTQALVVGARHADEMLERTRRQRGYQPQAVLLSASTSLWASLFSQASHVVCRCQFRRLKGGQEEVDLQSKRIARWF
jgi:hypothetical protein